MVLVACNEKVGKSVNPLKLVQSIASSGQLQDVKGVALKQGQLIHGRVEKLFPNNMALVRLGAMKVTAQLEAAISVMENHWFEVVGNNKGDVELRVVEHKGSGATQGSDSLRGLLQQFHLSETKPNLQLLQFFLSKNIPFTKEHLITASHLLKETKDITKGLQAFEQLMKKELPLTEGTFKAMMAVQGSKGISAELNQLSSFLNKDTIPTTEAVAKLKGMISTIQGELTQGQTKQIISELIKVLGSTNQALKESSFQLLQQIEIIPKTQQSIDSIQGMAKALNVNQDLLTKLDSFANATVESLSSQEINKASKMINEILHSPQNASKEQYSLLKQVIEHTFQKPVNFENGQEVKIMLKQMITSLGLEYESSLEGSKSELIPTEKLESLKPLLMKAMSELGAMGKELEPLLHKLTGIQLQSLESNSPMQQIMMNIPLSLGTKQTELTLQWNGRKDKDGKIDPGYCRILFYLDLEHIEETIIDMQVQNRIVTITLMNDSRGLENILTAFEDQLKDQLTQMNYKLSAIRVVTQSEKKESVKQELSHAANYDAYQGVDLKI